MQFLAVVLLFSLNANAFQETPRIDSLKFALEDESTLTSLYALAEAYTKYYQYDSANFYIILCNDLAKKDDNLEFIIKTAILKGVNDARFGFLKPSIDEHFEILKSYDISNKEMEADLKLSIAYLYNESKQVESGIPYALEAKDIYQSTGNLYKLIRAYNTIGFIMERLAEFEDGDAKKYDIDSAFASYQLAYDLAEQNSWDDLLAKSSENIASVYEDLGQEEQEISERTRLLRLSRAYYFKSLDINQIINNQYDLINNLNDIGDTYQKLGEYDSALIFYTQNLSYAEQFGFVNRIMYALDDLSETYYALGAFEEAYEIENKNEELIKKQFRKENMMALNLLMVSYETEKKEFEIRRQKNSRTILLLIIALISVLLIFIIFAYRQNILAKRSLTEKNELLLNLIATKDKFFSIIAHDVKSPLSSILGLTKLLVDSENSDENNKQYAELIQESSAKVYKLIDNLLDWARMQTGTINFEPKQIQLNQLIVNSIDLLKQNAQDKQIKLQFESKKEIVLSADEQMMHTVIRNLVLNAIKFTAAGGRIEVISHRVNDDLVKISIKDTGIGIRPENIKKLFSISESYSTKGTANEKGTGLGLILVKEFIDKHKGSIKVDSKVGKGTTISILLPIAPS